VTFGCRVNQADSLELERQLGERGLAPGDASSADVVIVNSCSVTATADQGARQVVRRINRENPSARILVTGCYATRCADDVRSLPGVCEVVPNTDKAGVADRVAAMDGLARRAAEGDGPCGALLEPGLAGRTAWTLRVQTGCEQSCSYCIIPLTRGRSRSRSLQEITAEIDRVSAAGFKEIIVTGVHLGSWGRDFSPRETLVDLLRALEAHPSDVLFRVSSLEPMDCTPAVRAVLLASRRFAPHFHLPLQHASDRILERMRRPYTCRSYDDLVASLRAAMPDASIGSDILVGFPGETAEDHARLVEWLERSPLTHLHVFPYSDRPGTPASGLPDKVHGALLRTRAEEVRRIGRELTGRFRASMLGRVRPALTLEDGSVAVTDNYLKVHIPPGLPRNQRVLVRLDDVKEPMRGTVATRA
jgi:threonylcarbamoyladenosine tRNA methylthiotransferase MtaB